MQARKKGHIVNISTWGVRMPPGARWAAYQASKGAFDTWLRSVALEIKADGITTTSIYPAIVYTRMSAPTPGMHSLPGMTTEDAAHVIELAVVEKPFEITPPWLHSWQIASVILQHRCVKAWNGFLSSLKTVKQVPEALNKHLHKNFTIHGFNVAALLAALLKKGNRATKPDALQPQQTADAQAFSEIIAKKYLKRQ